MKTRSKHIILTLALALLAPFTHAQSLSPQFIPPPVIPQPVVAKREVGQYLPQLEGLEKLLVEKKSLEFYEETEKMFGHDHVGNTQGVKAKFIKGNKPTKEEFATLEWVRYYRLIAPLVSFEELERNDKEWYSEDYSSKISACGQLCLEKTKELAVMFGIDENRLLKHRIETITATLRFLKNLSEYAEDRKFHEKEDRSWRQMEAERERKRRLAVLEENAARGNFDDSFDGSRITGASLRPARRFGMGNDIRNMLSRIVDDYVRKLVACFPKQQETIKEYMRKAGLGANKVYPEEFHFAVLFRNAVGRKPETEWLFRGLPSEEKITALEQRKIREGHERAAKAKIEYDRWQKQEAEKLAKRKAEEAREAQRREAEIKRRETAQARPSDPPNPDNPPKP
jgi:hypothetical protein